MKITLEVTDYDKRTGLVGHWEDDSLIRTVYKDNEFLIQANKEGLISLAIQLLSLAQDNVPVGTHFHYDTWQSLEEGSVSFIIDKIPSDR
ncbi:MAG: hypothetical protein ACHQHN_09050 [Sphingobacteriales bacterium]